MITKIVSGGQTGVDRAALDLALELGMPCGGWCPRGRRAEDGSIGTCYPLQETPSEDYAQRTEWNVRDSDATLVLVCGEVSGGTAQTVECAIRLSKPYFVLDLAHCSGSKELHAWISRHKISILNVAGPRESKSSGIYREALRVLRELLA